jgi:Skp family chaperone for outer membrane proteins
MKLSLAPLIVPALSAIAAAQDSVRPALPAQEGKAFKLGVVNLRTCFDKEKYERVKDVDVELQKLAEEFAKKLQDIEKEMERLQEQVKGLPPGSKLRQEKLAQLKRREADLKIERDLGKSLYLDFYGDKKIEIYNEIRRVVDLIGKEQKFDLVLRIEQPLLDEQDNETVTQRINNRVVLFHAEGLDITAAVVERLNAEYKKAKASGEKK